ncbi:hypothetical protein [Halocatena marina]|nr:hypothetical protein [Halocatena marina]
MLGVSANITRYNVPETLSREKNVTLVSPDQAYKAGITERDVDRNNVLLH